MSASKYVQAAVTIGKAYQVREYPKRKSGKRTFGPFPSNDAPSLQWIVELGRIDIVTEVLGLSFFLAMPREGHLDAVFHLFIYLEKMHNAWVVFDPSYPIIHMTSFKECDWSSFNGNVHKAIPPNAPEPCRKNVELRMFVDSDHAGDKGTRRSRKGFIIFLNMTPIVWF